MFESSFWRTEIWHPLTLHFPISVLLLATLAKLAALFLKEQNKAFWQRAGSYLLYFGCLTAWLSIYTGDLADGIVARKICDPTVLKAHEIGAYRLAYLFSVATVLDLVLYLKLIRAYLGVIRIFIFLLMLSGAALLVYTSHLGARVVYEQAGGVNIPSADCAGF